MKNRKRFIAVLLTLALALCACGGGQTASDVDVDLSRLSGTVVYGQVYDMVTHGSDYEGQTVRMKGMASTIDVMDKDKVVDVLHSCVIMDATKCCSQGIEFELADGTYPESGKDITVEGVWTTYTLYGIARYKLTGAIIK